MRYHPYFAVVLVLFGCADLTRPSGATPVTSSGFAGIAEEAPPVAPSISKNVPTSLSADQQQPAVPTATNGDCGE